MPTLAVPPVDDEALVERALSGDGWAKEALYRRHAPRLASALSHFLGTASEADDVLQDAFVEALTRLASLRDPAAFGSWLVAIAFNRARRRLRRRRWLGWMSPPAPADLVTLESTATGDVGPETLADLRRIDALLRRQPEEQRIAWLLHRVEERTIAETAEALERSTATIKRYVSAVDSALEGFVRLGGEP